MKSFRSIAYALASMLLSVGASVYDGIASIVLSAMPECTPEKAAIELEHAKQSLTKVTDNRKASKPDVETALARSHVSMLRGIGFGGAALA